MKTFIFEVETEDSMDKQTLQTLLGNLMTVPSAFNDIRKIRRIKIKEIIQ